MTTMGERIKALRDEKHWNRDALGERLGVTGSAVSMWEIDRRVPPAKVITAMCELFNVQYDYLMGLSDYRSAADEIIDRIASTEAGKNLVFLSDEEYSIIKEYRTLPVEMQTTIRNLIQFYQHK